MFSFSTISRRQKVVMGVAFASYSYGFYRSWTLPMWHNEYTSRRSEMPIRFVMSSVMGVMYVLPPFCLVKYTELGMRLCDVYYLNTEKRDSSHWQEWGFFQPRIL
jgi:hypothetical protein